jgi:leucyl-tRNA synthetase
MEYNFTLVEQKWQEYWEKNKPRRLYSNGYRKPVQADEWI